MGQSGTKSQGETVSRCDEAVQGLGGRSRAAISLAKLLRLWVPSQKGEFAEWPQRQRETAVRPPRPKAVPAWATISKSPSMRMGPLLKTVTLVPATSASKECCAGMRIHDSGRWEECKPTED